MHEKGDCMFGLATNHKTWEGTTFKIKSPWYQKMLNMTEKIPQDESIWSKQNPMTPQSPMAPPQQTKKSELKWTSVPTQEHWTPYEPHNNPNYKEGWNK